MENDKLAPKYVGAPYNFVELQENVAVRYDSSQELPKHNIISDELVSGEIRYTITPETAISVGGANGKNFYRNADKKLAIPGSTFRGLIRNNVQIISASSIGDDIDDYRIMFRKVAGKNEPLKKVYEDFLGVESKKVKSEKTGKVSTVSLCRKVKSGYITFKDGKYIIYPTVNDIKDKDNRNYFYLNSECEFVKRLQLCKDGEKIITDLKSTDYVPFYAEISYQCDNTNKTITNIGEKGVYSRNGYLVGSGAGPNKKALYVVPEPEIEKSEDGIEKSKGVIISEKSVNSFKIDFELKKNLLGTTSANKSSNPESYIKSYQKYFSLPEKNEIRPVFYITEGEDVYFGYTPYLRIFYRHSIVDGLPEDHKPVHKDHEPMWDCARAMFGFSNRKVSYKSRVYFSDAVYSGNEKTGKGNVVLGTPKPSSYYDYVKQDSQNSGNITTYHDDFRLRGFKQYWLRDEIYKDNKSVKDNVGSEFETLEKNQGHFSGIIYFKNLHNDELGLLLNALDMGEGFSQNIGKAKPYGYGRIKIKIDSIRKFDPAKMYGDEFSFEPYTEYTVKERENLKKEAFKDKVMSVTLRKMKNIKFIPDPEKIRYMDIEKKEYQSRCIPLQTIEQLVGNNNNSSPKNTSEKKVEKQTASSAYGNVPAWMKVNNRGEKRGNKSKK